MRVSMMYQFASQTTHEACTQFKYGEVEDYTVVFDGSSSCANPRIEDIEIDTKTQQVSFKWFGLKEADYYTFRYRSSQTDWKELETENTNITINNVTDIEYQIKSNCSTEFSNVRFVNYN